MLVKPQVVVIKIFLFILLEKASCLKSICNLFWYMEWLTMIELKNLITVENIIQIVSMLNNCCKGSIIKNTSKFSYFNRANFHSSGNLLVLAFHIWTASSIHLFRIFPANTLASVITDDYLKIYFQRLKFELRWDRRLI